MRNNPANPTSKRMKTKDASGKTKTGGILGQNKEKSFVSNAFGEGKSGTAKTKKRFGRTVETTRTASGKSKTVTKKSGEVAKEKRKGAAKMGMGGKVKAVKSYKKGGKVVSQGADKKDVRREKKQDRVAARAAAKAKRVGDRNFKRDVKSGKLKKA